MPRRERKRKICSCCEVPSPSVTSSQPDNATKRRKGNQFTTEPVIEYVAEKPPVNQSNQLVPSKVLAREVGESNEDIVIESAGHSTRRVRNRRCQTIRGRKFVHTFVTEVTYTVATTRLGYVGQELLPFQKRHNFFQKSSAATVTPSNSESHNFVKNCKKTFVDDNDFENSDTSFDVKSDCDNVESFEKSSMDNDDFRDNDSPFDVDSDADSVGRSEKSSDDDDKFKNSDSLPDLGSDASSAKRFKKSYVDNDSDSLSDTSSDCSISDSSSDASSVKRFKKASVDDDSDSLSDSDSDASSVKRFKKTSVEDDSDSLPDLGSDASSAKRFKKSSVDNDSDSLSDLSSDCSISDSSSDCSISDLSSDASSVKRFKKASADNNAFSDGGSSFFYSDSEDDRGCFSEFGVRCQWHSKISRIKYHCLCRFGPCAFDSRPVPAPCPKEMEALLEAFQSRSEEKKVYAMLQEVNLGYDDCSPCVYLYSKELLTICNRQQSNLRLDRTFNLGHCYVTMFAFRNGNFIANSFQSQYGPMMTGPVMIHFDKHQSTYLRFFKAVRDRCGITKKSMPPSVISDMSYVPKKDQAITEAMRLSFGTNMHLSSNHIVPTALRTYLKREVKCYSPVEEVVNVVHRKVSTERFETIRAIHGIRSGWRLTDHAKRYMEKWARSSSTARLEALDQLSPECE